MLTQFIPEILRFILTRLTLDLEALGPINVGDESGEHILCFLLAGRSSCVKFLFKPVAHFFMGSSQSHLDVLVPLPFRKFLI